MPKNMNQVEFGPQLPQKMDLEGLADSFARGAAEKGIDSLDAISALKDWIDTKQVQIEHDTEGHPDILRTVRFNLAWGIMYYEKSFYDEAEHAISSACGILENIRQHHTEDSLKTALDDYEHDIGYYLELIDKKRG